MLMPFNQQRTVIQYVDSGKKKKYVLLLIIILISSSIQKRSAVYDLVLQVRL